MRVSCSFRNIDFTSICFSIPGAQDPSAEPLSEHPCKDCWKSGSLRWSAPFLWLQRKGQLWSFCQLDDWCRCPNGQTEERSGRKLPLHPSLRLQLHQQLPKEEVFSKGGWSTAAKGRVAEGKELIKLIEGVHEPDFLWFWKEKEILIVKYNPTSVSPPPHTHKKHWSGQIGRKKFFQGPKVLWKSYIETPL